MLLCTETIYSLDEFSPSTTASAICGFNRIFLMHTGAIEGLQKSYAHSPAY